MTKLLKKIYSGNQYDTYEAIIKDGELVFHEGPTLYFNNNIYIYELVQLLFPLVVQGKGVNSIFDLKILYPESTQITMHSFIKHSSIKYQSISPRVAHMIYDENGFLNKFEDKIKKIKILRD